MKKVERIKRICPVCGSEFFIRPKQKCGIKYCSMRCFGSDPLRDKTRPNNGKNFGEPWAKGKSKETDERLNLISKKNKTIIQKMYDNGEIDLSKRKINYEEVARKVSDTISRKLADGTLENQHRFVKGWYNKKDGTQEYYESSYERKYMEMLDEGSTKWTKRHGIRIQYYSPHKHKMCYYVPDFFINENEIHEVKPIKRTIELENIAKTQAAEQYCLTNNLKYRIITENILNIKL